MGAEETLQRICSSLREKMEGGGGASGRKKKKKSSGKKARWSELKRVGQIPCREQRLKNRLNVQGSQAGKLEAKG